MGKGLVYGKPLNVSNLTTHMVIVYIELNVKGGWYPDDEILVTVVHVITAEERLHEGLNVINTDNF
jgi:hypothetical protein